MSGHTLVPCVLDSSVLPMLRLLSSTGPEVMASCQCLWAKESTLKARQARRNGSTLTRGRQETNDFYRTEKKRPGAGLPETTVPEPLTVDPPCLDDRHP